MSNIKMKLNYLKSLFSRNEGQGMVEYALLIGLIAIVVIAVLVFLGPAIADQFQEIIDNLGGTEETAGMITPNLG
jgi:pilus assembly protein Flp/PilA